MNPIISFHSKRMCWSSTCSECYHRAGLTLMELILSIALLSIIAAASFGILFWQAKTYYHIEQRTEAMTQLTNTYMVIYKEIKTWKHSIGNIIVDSGGIREINPSIAPPTVISEFSYNSTKKTLSWNGAPILKNAIATFSWNPSEQIVTGTLQKLANNENSTTRILAIKFVIHPRN